MEQVLAFIHEVDKLKGILRKTKNIYGDRFENSAEHSWHLCLMALVLAPHSSKQIDLPHVLKMLIVHDVVEIDAGDVIVYDEALRESKRALELAAADRIFGLLESGQGAELRALWDEFEAQETPESQFAAALDRAEPILCNIKHEGLTWRSHGVTYEKVLTRNAFIADVIPELWAHISCELEKGRERGYFATS